MNTPNEQQTQDSSTPPAPAPVEKEDETHKDTSLATEHLSGILTSWGLPTTIAHILAGAIIGAIAAWIAYTTQQ